MRLPKRLPERVRVWASDPDGGGRHTGQRDRILAHDRRCSSLTYVWLPHRKGYTNLMDLAPDCDGCGVTFYTDGVTRYDSCPRMFHFYCLCCLKKSGGECTCTTTATE